MEKKEKRSKSHHLLIWAVILFVVGALLFCGGMFALEWSFVSADTTEYKAGSWTDASGDKVIALDIRMSGRVVTVESVGVGEPAHVEWHDTESEKIEVTFSDGKLTIREKHIPKFPFKINWGNSEKNKMQINIPVKELDELKVRQSGGTFKLLGGIDKISKIDTWQDGGTSTYGDKDGAIEADTLTHTQNGGTSAFNGIKASGAVVFKQNGGTATLKEMEAKSFDCDKDGGTLRFTRMETNTLNLNRVNGGTIIGELVGAKSEYGISVNKNGGTCNVSNQFGVGKTITVRQNGGTIRLSFV
ncbi:MAG: DUF4097 domain-containing protein [Firmicutes bacterium]|nr:DUF4097 domain-containing protein [Bacillota bacterium]